MISPAEFIPVAEETGLINELGKFVLRAACAEAANWPDQVRVAVNVSPVQFRSQTLALNVATALAASGLAASRLELEITEAVLIRDDEAALDVLHQLRGLGVRIALDDFGTGYSSLSYLQRFPFDKIKIDRSFIKDIGRRRRVVVDRPGGGEHRRRQRHDDDGGRRRDRAAAQFAVHSRLHRDAGMSVQPCDNGRGNPAAVAFAPRPARYRRLETAGPACYPGSRQEQETGQGGTR